MADEKIMQPEYFTVSQYLDLLNTFLRREDVSVAGEIVEYKPGARWVGFTIKDKEDDSIMKCVLSAWDYKRIGVRIDVGMEVKVTGAPSISKKYGSFGFWTKHIEPLGEGALRQAYELLLKQLKEEGLFARKRSLPLFVQHIGVISSREGVVIHDFMNNLNPLDLKVSFIDARVEGDQAPGQLISALKALEAKNPDAIVIIRGGGSLESMQAFNNEAVCRAIYASHIPVAVGIGHDVDVPIACMVADLSASTPTAVAHRINETWTPLIEGLPRYAYALERGLAGLIADTYYEALRQWGTIATGYERCMRAMFQRMGEFDRTLLHVFHRLFTAVHAYDERLTRGHVRFAQTLVDASRRINTTACMLLISGGALLRHAKEKLAAAERLISLGDPTRNLAQGYSIVFDTNGRLIRAVGDATSGDRLTTRVSDGTIDSTVI